MAVGEESSIEGDRQWEVEEEEMEKEVEGKTEEEGGEDGGDGGERVLGVICGGEREEPGLAWGCLAKQRWSHSVSQCWEVCSCRMTSPSPSSCSFYPAAGTVSSALKRLRPGTRLDLEPRQLLRSQRPHLPPPLGRQEVDDGRIHRCKEQPRLEPGPCVCRQASSA